MSRIGEELFCYKQCISHAQFGPLLVANCNCNQLFGDCSFIFLCKVFLKKISGRNLNGCNYEVIHVFYHGQKIG